MELANPQFFIENIIYYSYLYFIYGCDFNEKNSSHWDVSDFSNK